MRMNRQKQNLFSDV